MVTDNQITWSDCPPGALVSLSRRARQRHLLQLATRTTAAVTAVALLSFTAWYGQLHWGQQQYQYYGLTCADVRELLPAYHSGRLDSRRLGVLVLHVKRCSTCAELRPLLRSEDGLAAAATVRDEPCHCCIHRSLAALHWAGDELHLKTGFWAVVKGRTDHRLCLGGLGEDMSPRGGVD